MFRRSGRIQVVNKIVCTKITNSVLSNRIELLSDVLERFVNPFEKDIVSS